MLKSWWRRFRNRPWEGCWTQRFGAWVLFKIEGDSYLGPTPESYRPRGYRRGARRTPGEYAVTNRKILATAVKDGTETL